MTLIDWTVLDRQMEPWAVRLRDDLGVQPADSKALASAIAREVSLISTASKAQLKQGSHVTLRDRLDELVAFQAWADLTGTKPAPPIARALVLTQLYICFVYLKDAWFRSLRDAMPANSATARVCHFLTTDPVRSFRNAIAHGRWRYRGDFGALEYWPDASERIALEVTQLDLDFWQALSRSAAYASIQTLVSLAA